MRAYWLWVLPLLITLVLILATPRRLGVGTAVVGPDSAPTPGVTAAAAVITQRDPIPPRVWVQNATGPVMRLQITDTALVPARVEAAQYDRVRLLVQNHGRAPHNLVIPDYYIFARGMAAGDENYIEFTADRKGEFIIYSDLTQAGRPEPGPVGSLIVR